MFKQVLT